VETVVLVDWPRVGYHRGEILKGLVGGGGEEAKRMEELQGVKDGIRRCVKLLTAVLEKKLDVGGEYRLLVESDGRLGGLLVV